MDTGFICEIFLAQSAFLAVFAYILAKAFAYIHAFIKTRMSSIDLQTMSDICLDFIARASGSVKMSRIIDIQKRSSQAAFGQPLINNVLRGLVVEAIVASALEPDWSWCAADYASWDFERADGLRLEVKQSAARQSWPTAKPARASFDIAARKMRWENQCWVKEPGRAAQIYIFAHHPLFDDRVDHRDPNQWDFYVIASAALPGTKRLSLASARKLSDKVGIVGLAKTVGLVADAT